MSDCIPLPIPQHDGTVSVERALSERRSVQEFDEAPLTPVQLAQILWAGQGISQPVVDPPAGWRGEWRGGLRTAPSAGALYPLELYVVVGHVEGVEPGLYRYLPRRHALEPTLAGDLRPRLADAALGQSALVTAPAVIVFAAVVERTAARYGDRAPRYVHMEVGAAAENVYLQAQTMGLGTVLIGAFRDTAVAQVLSFPADHAPRALMPIGTPQRR